MSMTDIRALLLKQMRELADSEATAEETKLHVDRAMASANVARAYVETVETEMAAIRVFDQTGVKPSIIDPSQTLRLK